VRGYSGCLYHHGFGGSFSVSVSPGTYNVDVSFSGDAADPEFVLCTVNVDLTASADDTLTCRSLTSR